MTKAISASTLARQAAKTTNKAEAKRLRAQAAKLRREERLARVAKMPHSTVLEAKRMDRAIAEGKHSGVVAGLNPVYMQPDTEQPGRGEIVGGYLAQKAKEIADLARKKGGVDAIQTELAWLEAQTKIDEKFYAGERERKAVQAVREDMRDKIVCGFIAVVDAAELTGAPPAVWCINSFTVANLIEALRANGYTAVGKR